MSDQEDSQIAYLGPETTFTHEVSEPGAASPSLTDNRSHPQAALQFSGTRPLLPQHTIEDVFLAVQSGTTTHGVVPFENSSNGPVIATLDLLADVAARFPAVRVLGEIYLPVHHHLIGRPRPPAPSDPPSPPALAHIRTLGSHPQAWGQCTRFLAAHLPPHAADRADTRSTAHAAARAAADPSGRTAAIASRAAAARHGLDVLAADVHDDAGNRTRFLVLGAAGPVGRLQARRGGAAEWCKALLRFTVPHARPGALAGCLAVLQARGLNLTSMHTRPSGEGPWRYMFFVEFESRGEDGVEEAVAELGCVAETWRLLGSWPDRLRDGDG